MHIHAWSLHKTYGLPALQGLFLSAGQWNIKWSSEGGCGGLTFWLIDATPTNLLHVTEHVHSHSLIQQARPMTFFCFLQLLNNHPLHWHVPNYDWSHPLTCPQPTLQNPFYVAPCRCWLSSQFFIDHGHDWINPHSLRHVPNNSYLRL